MIMSMSKKERKRKAILEEVKNKKLTLKEAALRPAQSIRNQLINKEKIQKYNKTAKSF
jgi:hypothetical protein